MPRYQKYFWQPSIWFKARQKLAPSFQLPVILELEVGFELIFLSSTPKLDFCFPQVSIPNVRFEPISVSQTDNILVFERVLTEELKLSSYFSDVLISHNLFLPLSVDRYGGKKYSQKIESDSDRTHINHKANSSSIDKDGYRKSFKVVEKDGSVKQTAIMSIWEKLLPLLESPISFSFPDYISLPSALYPYQTEGVKFLIERESALLGDDMGTGKTVQSIVALRMLFQRGDMKSALIIVPLTILKNWDRELMKWAPSLSGITIVRGSRNQREIQWEKSAHVWVATYGTIRTDIEEINKHRNFDLVIVDEIQAIKNRITSQSRAIKKLNRKRSWGLSGTPIENRLDDLFSIFDFLKPGLFTVDGVNEFVAKSRITPYFLRRRKQDVLPDLPPKMAFDVWLGMEGEQREVYDRAYHDGRIYLEKLGKEITVTHVLQLLQRLKMLCNRDPFSGKSVKLELLKDEISKVVGQGSKALVFSQYLEEGIEFIKVNLKKYNPVLVSGKVTGQKRDSAVDTFQNDDSCKLFLATPKSGGVGLNLVAGNYVFHFDHWWNPATVSQATDRVHRIGQTKDVFVYHFWTEGTIEERIYTILDRKQKLYSDVIDDLSKCLPEKPFLNFKSQNFSQRFP